MKKLVLVLALVLGVSTMAVAQDVSVADIFGAYSISRCEGRDSGDSLYTGCDLSGWDGGVDINLDKNWAVTVDVSGYYGWLDNYQEPVLGTSTTNVNARGNVRRWGDIRFLNVTGGPRYTFGSSELVRPYVHALFGVNHRNPLSLCKDSSTSTVFVSCYQVENDFMYTLGGGLDIKLGEKWFARPAQFDYVAIRRFNKYENTFRFSAGMGYKIGVK